VLGVRGALAWIFVTENRFRHGRLLPLYIKGQQQPVWIRSGTSDLRVFWQVFIQQQYARTLACVRDGDLIVDCGANVGFTALYFLARYPNLQIIAVEPDPANVELCKKNLAAYGDRVTLVQAAVWPRAERLSLGGQQAGNEWGISVAPSPGGPVQSVTIPDLLERSGRNTIDLLKVDIEGAEASVFAQDCPWLENVKAIAIELHGQRCADAFWSALRPFDYEFSEEGELTLCEKLMRKGTTSSVASH